MPVVLRDPRSALRRRAWLDAAYREWLAEVGASSEELTGADRQLAALLLDPRVIAVVVERDGEPAGFALLRREDITAAESRIVLLDFYVLPASRRLGVGREAARLLFERFTGHWEIAVLGGDTVALGFWRRVLQRHAPGSVHELREAGRILQRFTSKGAR